MASSAPIIVAPGKVVEATEDIVWDYLSIDNPGDFWFYLPQINRWVGPNQTNIVIPWGVSPGTFIADSTKDPSGVVQPASSPLPIVPATLFLTDNETGSTLSTPSLTPTLPVSLTDNGTGLSTASKTVSIKGVKGVGIIFNPSSGASTSFTVKTLPSNNAVAPQFVGGSGAFNGGGAYYTIGPEQFAAIPTTDTAMIFTVSGGGAVNPNATLYAFQIDQFLFSDTNFIPDTGINVSQQLSGNAVIGANSVSVNNANGFTPGAAVNIHRASDGKSEQQIVKSASGSQITFDGTLVNSYSVGDTVMELGIVGIYGQPINTNPQYRAFSGTVFSNAKNNARVDQTTANGGVDIAVANLNNDAALYRIHVTAVNTSTTLGPWCNVRLKGLTSGTNIYLADFNLDTKASGLIYRDRFEIGFVPPLDPNLFSGQKESWQIVLNATQTGVFWGFTAVWG